MSLFLFIATIFILVLALIWKIKKRTLVDFEALYFEELQSSGGNPYHVLVHPLMGYLWAQWYVTNDYKWQDKDSRRDGTRELKNPHNVLIGDIIYVEASALHTFYESYLPYIRSSFILITGRFNLPQVMQTNETDKLLRHPMIWHWFSQNPIYENESKYTGIPYGLNVNNLHVMSSELLRNAPLRTNEVLHAGLSETNAKRKILMSFQDSKMSLEKFYEQLHRSIVVISPCGDRCDCYRHAEAILLGCVPIGQLPSSYLSIYRDAYVNLDHDVLNQIARTRRIPKELELPQLDITKRKMMLQQYWKFIIHKKQEMCRNMNKHVYTS